MIRSFDSIHRAWESTWIDGPEDDPLDRWIDELEHVTDDDLIFLGEQIDTGGQRIDEDRHWIAEMKGRGLL